MDVALIISSLSLTSYLSPVCLSHQEDSLSARKRNYVSIQLVAVLSLSLLTLSVVECVPSSWLLLFTNDKFGTSLPGRLSVAAAYSVILSTLCFTLLLAFPAIIGVHLVSARRGNPDSPLNRGLQSTCRSKVLRIAAAVGLHVVQLLLRVLLAVWRLISPCRRIYRRRDERDALPLTQQQLQLQQRRTFKYVTGRLIASVILVFTLWSGLRSLSPLVMEIPRRDPPYLTIAVSWLCAVGLLLSAVLNGFGSVSFPYTCLTPFYLKPITNETITAAQAELEHLQRNLDDRISHINEPTLRMQTLAGATSVKTGAEKSYSGSSSWRGRNSSFSDLGDEVVQRRTILVNEIGFLESLIDDTKDDLAEMKRSQQLSLQARTPIGRIKSWLGVVMSMVLLLRLFAALLSFNAERSWQRHSMETGSSASQIRETDTVVQPPRIDVVTVILLWFMGHTRLVTTQQQLNRVSQFVSLVLSAFLSVSQVQTFLRTASAVNRRLSSLYSQCHRTCHKKGYRHKHRSDHASTETLRTTGLLLSTVYSYVLAALAGCYFVACIVLTKLMLPEAYSQSFTQALSGNSGNSGNDDRKGDVFWVRSGAINAVFGTTAVATAVVMGLLFGIQKQNTHRYSSWTTNSGPLLSSAPDRRSSHSLEP